MTVFCKVPLNRFCLAPVGEFMQSLWGVDLRALIGETFRIE